MHTKKTAMSSSTKKTNGYEYYEPRLDDPVLFRSDVSSSETNLTRFDYPRVSSSSEDLHIQFAFLGFINILVSLSCGLLILSILRSKKLRNRPFDLYLLFIAIPDFWSGISCMLTCLLSVRKSTYYSETMCGYQSFYLNTSVCANTWMNAVIVYQIHKLLRYSNQRRRYIPPTKTQVCCHAGCVYSYSIMWGALSAVQRPMGKLNFPSHAYSGFYCIPMEVQGNSWFFYLVFLNGVFVAPAIFSVSLLGHIFYKGLLPKTGKRRQLAIFLMRIIFLYFVVFLPVAISVLIGNFVYFNTNWGYYVPAVMTHLQGILTTALCYCTNKEIANSMKKVLKCDWKDNNSNNSNNNNSNNNSSNAGADNNNNNNNNRRRSSNTDSNLLRTLTSFSKLFTSSSRQQLQSQSQRMMSSNYSTGCLNSSQNVSSSSGAQMMNQPSSLQNVDEEDEEQHIEIESDEVEERSHSSFDGESEYLVVEAEGSSATKNKERL